MTRQIPTATLQFRVMLDRTKVFGPGKADLLEHIAATGSISAAARRMRVSYKRAWQLVDEVNRAFSRPLVAAAAGGVAGGGASLSATGEQVLASYRSLQRLATRAAQRELRTLGRLATREADAG